MSKLWALCIVVDLEAQEPGEDVDLSFVLHVHISFTKMRASL